MSKNAITLKKALMAVRNKILLGSVHVKEDGIITPKSTFTFESNEESKKVWHIKDIQFLMIERPNKKAFNFLYDDELYTTDSSNYSFFKDKWNTICNASQKM